MHRVVAELVSQCPGLRLDDLAPASWQSGARYLFRDATVVALGEDLRPRRSQRLSVSGAAKLLTATPGLDMVVFAGPEELIIAAIGAVHRLPIANADSATWLPSGRLLVTAPIMEQRTWQGRTYLRKTRHRVILLAADTGTRLDEAVLDVDDAGVTAVAHPHDGCVLLDAGEGQDGSRVFAVRADHDRLAVDLVLENVAAAGFAPAGDVLLITPHPSFDDVVSVLTWPDLRPKARVSPADLDGVDDAFDFYGCFLSDDRVLLRTVEHGLVLYPPDLRQGTWIDLSDSEPAGEVEISTIFGIAPDIFAAELWTNNAVTATVWRVPSTPPAFT